MLGENADGDIIFRYHYKGTPGKSRRAVLPKMCYQAICAYLVADGRDPETMQPEDYIFIALDPTRITRIRPDAPVVENRPISNSQANSILQKYARRANVAVDKAHIHGLRHAGLRMRVQKDKAAGKGVDYEKVQTIAGHGTLAVTQIYTNALLIDPEDSVGQQVAMDLMPKGARRKKKGPQAEQGTLL